MIAVPKFTSMKGLYIFSLLFFLSSLSFGQVAGSNNGTTFANVPLAGSASSWSNTGNVASSNDAYSTFGALPNNSGPTIRYTDYLQITGFNFSIPSGVLINGIVVEIERSDPNSRTSDYRIQIVKGGVIGATDRSASASYPINDSYQSFGNAGDLWGETWTEADINNSGFGVAIAARRSVNGSTTSGRVDNIRITVFFDFIALPLKLTGFSANQKGKDIQLRWSTTDESNMSHFELERSFNAREFTEISRTSILNRNTFTNYSYTDQQPGKGINYYRLKMIEINGRIYYSGTVAVSFKTNKIISVYPNPVQKGNAIFINNPSGEKLNVSLYNSSGKLRASGIVASNRIPADLLKNCNGIIYYRIANTKGEVVGKGSFLVQ